MCCDEHDELAGEGGGQDSGAGVMHRLALIGGVLPRTPRRAGDAQDQHRLRANVAVTLWAPTGNHPVGLSRVAYPPPITGPASRLRPG
jgi:hypothetical protein